MTESVTRPPDAPLSPHDEALLQGVLTVVEESGLPLDAGRIEAAFRYAQAHHAGQKRKSGEDFIIHPVEVAKIVVSLMLDTESVMAALLHDVVEDCDGVEKADIAAEFGDEVATLVEGVTNLTRIHFASREQAQIEN